MLLAFFVTLLEQGSQAHDFAGQAVRFGLVFGQFVVAQRFFPLRQFQQAALVQGLALQVDFDRCRAGLVRVQVLRDGGVAVDAQPLVAKAEHQAVEIEIHRQHLRHRAGQHLLRRHVPAFGQLGQGEGQWFDQGHTVSPEFKRSFSHRRVK